MAQQADRPDGREDPGRADDRVLGRILQRENPVNNGAGGGIRLPKSERKTYQEICEEYQLHTQGDFGMYEKYSFEEVITYHMEPGEDWNSVLATHVKVSLDGEKTYVINSQVFVSKCIYLIGNGATVFVECPTNVAIRVLNASHTPSIYQMWAPTFFNVVFQKGKNFEGNLMECATYVICHGCNFMGFPKKVLGLDSGGAIRGCYFSACYKCIVAHGSSTIVVKNSTFYKNVVCIKAECDVKIKENAMIECCAFLHVMGTGIIRGNTFSNAGNELPTQNLVTCAKGEVIPLCSVHIVRDKVKRWPEMKNNLFTRCKVYLGFRNGPLDFKGCTFHYVTIYVDKNSADSVRMHGAYFQTILIAKVVKSDTVGLRSRKCICGNRHGIYPFLLASVTSESLPHPQVSSCNSFPYASTDDETGRL